jgi:hypothetical protein
MEDEEFKKIRHRFWRLGKERRFTVIKKMGFQSIEPYSGMDLSAEKTQREMLYHAIMNEMMKDLIALIEEQEALITAEEESGGYFKEPRPTEFPPSKEELEKMKYVPGTKKEI